MQEKKEQAWPGRPPSYQPCIYLLLQVEQFPPRQAAQGLVPRLVMAFAPGLPTTMGPPVTKDPVDRSFLTFEELHCGHRTASPSFKITSSNCVLHAQHSNS
jgi:hypothetical protein